MIRKASQNGFEESGKWVEGLMQALTLTLTLALSLLVLKGELQGEGKRVVPGEYTYEGQFSIDKS